MGLFKVFLIEEGAATVHVFELAREQCHIGGAMRKIRDVHRHGEALVERRAGHVGRRRAVVGFTDEARRRHIISPGNGLLLRLPRLETVTEVVTAVVGGC